MKTEMVGDLVGSQIPVYHRMIKNKIDFCQVCCYIQASGFNAMPMVGELLTWEDSHSRLEVLHWLGVGCFIAKQLQMFQSTVLIIILLSSY